MSGPIEKIKRHLAWELFWMSLKYPVIGIAIMAFGIINPQKYGMVVRIAVIAGGILFTILGIFLIRKNYKTM